MDEYEKKFADMQKYIPFLEAMIERLQKVTDKSREVQLIKMQQLHGILTDNKRKLRIETLQKCEDVLQKLHSKVEKGSNASLNVTHNKKGEQPSVSRTVGSSEKKSSGSTITEMEETPASPSPPASPDEQSHPKSSSSPIIIPTERKHDYSPGVVESKPASPDQSERVSTKEPIIIPTERKPDALVYNKFQNKSIESKSAGNPMSSHTESSKQLTNLNSPENRSVRSREPFSSPSKSSRTSTPLLVSLNEPPLSMEDLAELLNDGSDSNTDNPVTSSEKIKSQYPKTDRIQIPKKNILSGFQKKTEKNTSPKSFMLTQEDIDRESNRRWEEIDKHIVMFGRKVAQTDGKISSVLQSNQPPGTSPSKKTASRDNPISPIGKDRASEPRYADNYEKLPRPDRPTSDPSSSFDKNVVNSAFTKAQSNHLGSQKKSEIYQSGDDVELFSRRPNPSNEIHRTNNDSDYRRDIDYQMTRTMLPHQARDHRGSFDQTMQQSYQNHQKHTDAWKIGSNAGVTDHHHMSPPYHHSLHRPRPLMSPSGRSDMHHSSYMESNFSDDIRSSPQPPPLMSPILNSPPFNQRGYSDNRQFDGPFDRLGDYSPGMRNRTAETNYQENQRVRGPDISIPYNSDMSRTCFSWNRTSGSDNQAIIRNRSNDRFQVERGQYRSGSLDSQHPGFTRRGEWDRNQQSEIPSRFNRDSRNPSERDPRFRRDPSPLISSPPGVTTSKRDPRLIKNSGPLQTVSKTKEALPANVNRDPRVRTLESIDQTNKPSAAKSSRISTPSTTNIPGKREKEGTTADNTKSKRSSTDKSITDKVIKDTETMQSPLESLYGVIDTTAKTGKGYGLQKFKIPKIKKPEVVIPRPPTPPKPSINSANNDSVNHDCQILSQTSDANSKVAVPTETDPSDKQEEKKMEVSSTTDEHVASSTELEHTGDGNSKVSEAECTILSQPLERSDMKVSESEAIVDTSTSTGSAENKPKGEMLTEVERLIVKDEITRELIEKMIKTSLEQGEGRKLLEQARLLQKLGEGLAHSKKFKKIQKIIEDQSESNSSETESIIETKKPKKKRRVIVSESSGEESTEESQSVKPPPLSSEKTDKTSLEPQKTSPRVMKSQKSRKFDEEKSAEEEKCLDIPKTLSQTDNLQEKEPLATAGDSETVGPKPRKKPAKRRNSLEMLQEDIREMFISEGVVTATGHRMCRLIKESDGNLKSVDDKVKGIYSTSSLEDHNDSCTEEPNFNLKKLNRSKSKISKLSETSSEEPKSKGKTRKSRRRAAKVSKQYVNSSESEEELKLTTRSRAASQRNLPGAEKDSKDPTTNPEEAPLHSPETPMLRRSERVSLREPRVIIEKTDLGKIDSSKIMFDTSSDESFGIDVSELTAAVDISLHSDRQKCSDDGGDSSLDLKEPNHKDKSSINETVADESRKDGDETTNTIVNTSLCSSPNTSNVNKTADCTPVLSTNDELLTNLLGELVKNDDDVNIVEKSIEKQSDGGTDGETEESTVLAKKPATSKRKRKRNNWKTGSLPKSKKKAKKKPTRNVKQAKISSSSSSSSAASASKPEINIEHSIATPTKESINIIDTVESLKPESAEAEKEHESDLNDERRCSSIKQEMKVEESENIDDCKAPAASENVIKTETLIEYAWTGQDKYKCLLCSFSGKNIVQHYKTIHPKDEVMISRLTLLDAQRAIDESKDEAFLKLSEKVNTGPERKYTCRFCLFMTEGPKLTAMETFYEHCTTHTGEYRYKCRSCNYSTPLKSSIRTHFYKVCRKNFENLTVGVIEEPVPDDNLAYGYLCTLCNFIQFKENNIKKHINTYHINERAAKIVKVNMSSYLDLKENVEHSDLEEDTKIEEAMNAEKSVVEFNRESKQMHTRMSTSKTESANECGINASTSSQSLSPPFKLKSSQQENENHISNKLNAFVCPPELEYKEVEIQKERQKTMQELLNNYGKKFKNNASANGLSIIDKLKDKITTLARQSDNTDDDYDDDDDDDDDGVGKEMTLSGENKINQDPLKLNSDKSSSKVAPIAIVEMAELRDSNNETSQDEEESIGGTLDKKPRDPLMSFVEDVPRDVNSGEENSDYELTTNISRPYEDSSDTSEELSESELSADVSSLLQETINTPTKAPMITTIQRLAAQLQGSKSTITSNSSGMCEDASSNIKNQSEPIVMPLSELRNFVQKQKLVEKRSPEGSDGEGGTSRSNTPKNFIRLRRLSGDKLSSGMSTPETLYNNEIDKSPDLPENQQEDCLFLKIENVVSLAPNAESDVNNSLVSDIRKAVATSPVRSGGISVLKKGNTNIMKTFRKPIGKIDRIISKFPLLTSSSSGQTIKVIQPASKSIVTPMKSIITSVPSSNVQVVSKNSVPPSVAITSSSGLKLSASKSIPTQRNIASASTVKMSDQGKNYKVLKVVRPLAGIRSKEAIVLNTQKEKTFEAFTTMLQASKLRHMYKCMDRSCTYSTDSSEQFGQHYEMHKKQLSNPEQMNPAEKGKASPSGYQKCAYCSETSTNWNDLQTHYKMKHTFCAYQCGYCFYRAFSQSYVEIHQSAAHHGKPPSVILGSKDQHPIEIIDRRENVHPFICKHECNKLFYVPEAFLAHLKVKHGATLSIFKCHLCPASSLKAESLISHYKLHGIYRYQCLYCLFGADATLELHHHLSNMHCNRPPKILERALPASPMRDKDVLLQLVIRNLDDKFPVSQLKNVTDVSLIDPVVRKQRMKELLKSLSTDTTISHSVPEQPEIIDLLDCAQQDSSFRINPSVSEENAVRTHNAFNDNVEVTPIRQSHSNDATIIGNSTLSQNESNFIDSSHVTASGTHQAIHDEPELLVTYANEQIKTKIINAVDPLSLEDGINSADEFVNINVLDNPEFLKTAERLRIVDKATGSQILEDKDDDSDIEILECIEPTKKPKLQLTPIKESLRPFLRLKEEIKEPEIEKPTPTDTNSTNDNSNNSDDVIGSIGSVASTPGKEHENNTNKNDKDKEIIEKPPLTLNDIQHTGLCDKDLYKCGNEGCTFEGANAGALRGHIPTCTFFVNNSNFKCVHCNKKFIKVGNLIDHYKIHGLKRFGCSLCNMRYALACQAVAHMKSKHKVSSHKLVPADPTNPSPDALFVVQPLKGSGDKKGKKLSKTKSLDLMSNRPSVYGPNEIEKLPRPAIYNREVGCAVCPYTTKVRTNIIRHLQLHAKDETVPESGPVNPVPCLDKKEKMFDKMVNLASSSHQNGRMGGKTKETGTDNEAEMLPKFIPEKQRYVCCVNDCNCLTISEDLLRCHLKALHPDEPFFRCPHCSPTVQDSQSIPIDKLGVHLKMHDTRLYKCSHCNHHHYHRHVVERHLTDKHPEKRPFVKVIREIENPESLERPPTDETEEGNADPDGNHWKCNVCDYRCVYKTEMVAHASSTHDEKAQFKCTLCPYKTSGKISFEQHILSKHLNEPEADYTMVYERIKGSRKTDNVQAAEAPTIDEPFDTTPLWRRDMPRIRHIRGILLEEENDKKTPDNPGKSAKRKLEADSVNKQAAAKIKPKSVFVDGIVEKSKSDSGKSCGKVYTNAELTKKFGPYGRPSGNMYNCTICSTYSSKYRQDIRDHLYMELQYWRWHCTDCGHLAVSHSRMLKHENKVHKDKKPVTVELEEKEDVEKWVMNLMNTQRDIMKGEGGGDLTPSPKKSKVAPSTRRISPPTITIEDSDGQIVPSSSMETGIDPAKTIDLTAAISRLSRDSKESDVDDDDGNDLIIASPFDDKANLSADQIETSLKEQEKVVYTCKHCNLEFTGLRGFKIHVQINHLKRLAFICPYCDRSTNSETMMKAHIRTKHPGEAETIMRNPQSNASELSSDFWEKEYGIVIPKKSRGKKRKFGETNTTENEDKPSSTDACTICGFTAVSLTGLKAHMRTHTKKDLLQHSNVNHPELEWKVEKTNSSASTSDDRSAGQAKKRHVEDYTEDIEEETATIVEESVDKSVRKIYACAYCNSAQSLSIATIKSHWSQCHKNSNERSIHKTGVPFKFIESVANVVETSRLVKCGYCSQEGSTLAIKAHSRMQHPNLSPKLVKVLNNNKELWVCGWCEEKVEGNANKTSHHAMFHSHLPMRFKSEQASVAKPKGYACPVCSFVSVSLPKIKNHIAKHGDLFRCKRCSKTFYSLQKATQHSTINHAGLAAAIERVKANTESRMLKVSESDLAHVPEDEPQTLPPTDIFRNLGVARKSTTKQLLKKTSNAPRTVARKSTHPLPRYPPGLVFAVGQPDNVVENVTESTGSSSYGRPGTPVNLADLNTVIWVGATKMKVKCSELAKLMNIDVKIELVDCMKAKSSR